MAALACLLPLPPRHGFGVSLGASRSASRTLRRDCGWRVQAGKESVEAPERLLAAAGYFLPLLDGVQFGRYFLLQFPSSQAVLQPILPLLHLYNSFPFSNTIAFFTLYLLVVRNNSFSRFVRFNSMQAVVLDVLLILPSLVERTFQPDAGLGFELLILVDNTVFLFLLACFFYGVSSCLLGISPRLPLVADAADAQVEWKTTFSGIAQLPGTPGYKSFKATSTTPDLCSTILG